MNRATKADKSTKIYDGIFGVKENHSKVNKIVKAVVINFGTHRKYADFTNGKRRPVYILYKLSFAVLM